MKAATIYDIANSLNISPATVSRALKKHPAISEKTIQKVEDMAVKLNYRSNPFASNLRKKSTNTIGVIVPKLNSSFVASVLSGIEKVINQHGYNLIISQSLENHEKELTNVQTMFRSRIDGLIVSMASDSNEYELFNQFLDQDIPLVFFDRVPLQINCPQVVIDNFRASFEITKLLISKSCRNIVHVTGNLNRNVYSQRLEGYKAALKDADISFDEKNLFVSDLSESSGIELANILMDWNQKPDAVFVTNDTCAAALIHQFQRKGLKIPENIAVAGFNNEPISRLMNPAITTINYPGEKMGEIAAQQLLNQLLGKIENPYAGKILIETELLERESTNRNK